MKKSLDRYNSEMYIGVNLDALGSDTFSEKSKCLLIFAENIVLLVMPYTKGIV